MDCLIIADMEGITGITKESQFLWKTRDWMRARRLMTNEVLAIIHGLDQSSVVEHVVVRDVHDRGFNILPQMLNAKQFRTIDTVSYIGGQGQTNPVMIGDIGAVDFAILTGMHARSGSERFEPWAHTFTRAFSRVALNGVEVTEAHLFSSLLQEWYHVPTALITGTYRAIDEIKDFLQTAKLIANPLIDIDLPGSLSATQISNHYEFLVEQASEAAYQVHYKVLPSKPWNFPMNVELSSKSGELTRRMLHDWGKSFGISLISENTMCFGARSVNEALTGILTIGLLTPIEKKMLRMASLARFSWWIQSKLREPDNQDLAGPQITPP